MDMLVMWKSSFPRLSFKKDRAAETKRLAVAAPQGGSAFLPGVPGRA